jgi:hypothetical protein
MKNVDWPSDEVANIAGSSGRPLEVTCAQAFIAAGWTVDLGSYFVDGDRIREFDVLATREVSLEHAGTNLQLRVRAMVSCKGCRPTCSPLTYSVSTSSIPPCPPRVRSLWRFRGWGRRDDLERQAGGVLLNVAGLTTVRPFIAFDVIERDENTKKNAPPIITFKSLGDKTLYDGIDSAIKASSYWIFIDNQYGADTLTLYVPVLLLADAVWDVCLDSGRVGNAEIQRRGYHSCRYPIGPPLSHHEAREVTTLIWSCAELSALLSTLQQLHDWLHASAKHFLPDG